MSTLDSIPSPNSSDALVDPDCIAAGIGLAERSELCGLLAVLEVTGAISLAKGAIGDVANKLGAEFESASRQLARTAQELDEGPIPTDVLRHRLWHEIGRGLDAEALLPLSIRKTTEAAVSIGVRAAERLSPGIYQMRKIEIDQPATPSSASLLNKFARSMTDKISSRVKPAPSLSFPEVVQAELEQILIGLSDPKLGKDLDPMIIEAVKNGQAAMLAAAGTGGGWAAFAAAVGAAGFAPYIFAAQLSAFVPLVSGPALVSFLAVIINPVTVIAGVAAIGAFGVAGSTNTVKAVVASRFAVLLALRGMEGPEEGIAKLVNAFRRLPDVPPSQLGHLSLKEKQAIRVTRSRIESKLGGPIPSARGIPPGTWGAAPDLDRRMIDFEVPAVAGLTAADMLFHSACIDPAVLAAADFSRILDLHSPLDLAAHADGFVSEGALISLRGYTAEQIVLARLIDDGHTAQLAPESTTAGYDLIVDGCEVQVKCGANLSLLHEHFSRYPDIPVIADTNLAQLALEADAPWSHLVSSVEGFHLEAVEDLVNRTLQAAGNLADVNVPLFACTVALAKGAYQTWKGEIRVADLPAWLVVDLSVRGVLATVGKVGGGTVGLLVIGPAGALILGPVIGVAALLGAGKAKEVLDGAIFSDWQKSVMHDAGSLYERLNSTLQTRVDLLLQRQEAMMRAGATAPADIKAWIDAKGMDDFVFALELFDDLKQPSDLRSSMELLVLAARHAPFDLGVSKAREQLIEHLQQKPSLGDVVSDQWRQRWPGSAP